MTETPREKFERTKEPQDFLFWLNYYTNTKRNDDDELHALCSWAHSVINNLDNYKKMAYYVTEGRKEIIKDQEDIDRAENEGMQ